MNTDRLLLRVIGFTVCLVGLASTLVALLLVLAGQPVPDQLDRIVNLTIGALLGRLTTTTSGGPQEVVTPPGEPLETVDAGATRLELPALVLLAIAVVWFLTWLTEVD